MTEYALTLIQRYYKTGVLIDTNLLLLYIIGTFAPEEISKFKKTSEFSWDDFQLLDKLIGLFPKVFTTPHILTEVSDFAAQFKPNDKANKINSALFEVFSQLISAFGEVCESSSDISKKPEFLQFGLADAGIISIGKKYLVLTNDSRLFGYLQNSGIDAINLNHLRNLI